MNMKMHFWERIEHRLHRHASPTGPDPKGVAPSPRTPGRINAWLSRIGDTLPHFERSDRDDQSKPH